MQRGSGYACVQDTGIDDSPQLGTCTIGVRGRYVIHRDDPFDHVGKHRSERTTTNDDGDDATAAPGKTSQGAVHTDDSWW